MPEIMRCCVRQPEACGAVVVCDGKIYNWLQVDVPPWGLLCFCPDHEEVGKRALQIAERAARIEESLERYWIERHGG